MLFRSTTLGKVVDLAIVKSETNAKNWFFVDRLRGAGNSLFSNGTSAEQSLTDGVSGFDINTGFKIGAGYSADGTNTSGQTYVDYSIARSPSFMDVVCYTGTGSATTFSHNLGVAPELIIVKQRNTTRNWAVYSATAGNTKYLILNKIGRAHV